MKDMRSFIELVKRKTPKDFVVVKKEINKEYEITALVKKLERNDMYPVLYFINVKNSKMPVLCNLYGTRQRLSLAIGTDPENLINEYARREDNPLKHIFVTSSPAQELIYEEKDVDIHNLPVIKAHEVDVAPYITTGLVIVKDKDTDVHNVSFGRLQVVDKNTVYTHITPGRHLHQYYTKCEKKGIPLEISVCLGTHPAWALGALSLVPIDVDELDVMGAMAGEPLEMVRCKTVDADAISRSEIIIEGEILPNIRGKEGPYCEFTGYATGQRDRNVVKVKAITMRKDAIYHGLIAGSTEHRMLGSISKEAFLLKTAKVAAPSVKAVHIPVSGCGRYHCYVSMEKKAKGQPKNVAMAIFGADIYPKHVIVVDEDIDIYDEKQVLWAIATRVQGDRDIITIPRSLGSDLDPSADEDGLICKTIIDATAKPFLSQFHPMATIPKEIMDKIKIEDYLT